MLRILHVTDLHYRGALPGTSEIACRRSRRVPELLDRLEARLDALAPDVVAVTGDLLHAPYGLFRGENRFDLDDLLPAVAADYAYLRSRFESWGRPYLVLPGNHDHEPSFFAAFPQEPELESGGHRLIAFRDREHAGNVPFRVDGELARFADVLSSSDGLPQIHLQHYVIRPFVDHPYPHNYGDADDLAGALAATGRVKAVLAGHYHPGSGLVTEQGVHYLVGPALCEPPHRVRLVMVDDNSRMEFEEVPLGGGRSDRASRPVVVVSRDLLLDEAAHFNDPGGVVAAADLSQLRELAAGAALVCDASLDRSDLAGLEWASFADAHDRVHERLAAAGIALDALYYTTARSSAEASAAGLPRIVLGPNESIEARLEGDLDLRPAPVWRAIRTAAGWNLA